ncbi:MAG: anaerobic ribonucleoside-triphosphate reductase activating protein [Candidatus Lokiarchaeota archaeon]|nr:anaerobic ribonucleoside-triphosphate reductase activating protein [Candidatus Lokiarchaeota archaeon]
MHFLKLSIGGIKDISTIDYPEEAVTVIFTCGCPFKCPYCQNWAFFDPKNCKDMEIDEIIALLTKYSKFTTGLTITGGEPTLQGKSLIQLLKRAKKIGKIKLDTNGFYPEIVKEILKLNLVNYIAMDIKAPLVPEFYGRVCGREDIGDKIVKNIKKSYEIISNRKDIKFEARITIVPDLIDKEEDILQIAKEIKNVNILTLQQFRSDGGTLDPIFNEKLSPTREKILKLAKKVSPLVNQVRIRTLVGGEEIIND